MEDPSEPGSEREDHLAVSPEATHSTRTALIVGVVGVLVVALLVAVALTRGEGSTQSATSGPAGTTTTSTTRKGGIPAVCAKGNWPTLFEGRSPKLTSHTGPQVFIWRENDGWSIRAFDPTGADITIVLTGSAAVLPSDFKTDSPDGGELEFAANTATFKVKGSSKPNGFDFKACFFASMSVQLWAGDQPWPAGFVTVGKGNQPLGYPIQISRSA